MLPLLCSLLYETTHIPEGHMGALVAGVFLLVEPPLVSMSFFKEVDDFLAVEPPVGNQ